MRPPINATGTILHPEFGPPPLAEEAVAAVAAAAQAPAGTGPLFGGFLRSRENLSGLLASLTGAEEALVVSNVQAAVFLVLYALVRHLEPDREIIVSGEDRLAEGLSGPLFNVLALSGARLKKTSRSGVAEGNREGRGTGALHLNVNGGDARISVVSRDDLNSAAERELPAVKILSHATLIDLTPFGLVSGLRVQESVAAGFDVVVFGGDRLLGGPPVGIIVGRRKHLALIRKEPLLAALTADSLASAALEATLELYASGKAVRDKVPLLRLICAPAAGLRQRAERLAEALQGPGGSYDVRVALGEAGVTDDQRATGLLPTYQVCIGGDQFRVAELYRMLRQGNPPVLPRYGKDGIRIDLRSVPEEQDEDLLAALLASLRSVTKRDAAVLDSVSNPIWILDNQGVFILANRACAALWGVRAEDVTGRRIAEFVAPEQYRSIREAMDGVLESGAEAKIEVQFELPDGKQRFLELSLAPVPGPPGEEGRITFSATDVTDRKHTEEELVQLSMHDALTGLYNRLYFEEEMRRLDAERHYPVSVVVCDVDGLKLINDALGHDKGDELLKAAARTIRGPFRTSDVVARIGGDEFVVILPKTDERTAADICTRIRKAVEEYNLGEPELPLYLSVGFATGTDPSQGIKEVLRRADSDMYENKYRHSEESQKKIFEFFLRLLAAKGLTDEGHTLRLQRMVQLLGQAVGLSPDEIKSLALLCRVYDLGKIAVDDAIVSKSAALTNDEWEEMKRHSEIGERIARASRETEAVADYILQHHERWDGRGYPQGLRGRNIHLYSRILAVVDAYQAMTSPRPYREPLSHEEAIQELKKHGGSQFDPRLVDIFVSLFDQEYLM